MQPVRTLALPQMPPSPGVMVAVGRVVAFNPVVAERRHVVVRRDERRARRYLGDRTYAAHRACTTRGGGHPTSDMGRRLARQFPATGTTGAAGVDVDDSAGNRRACDDAGDVAVATGWAVDTGGDVTVITARRSITLRSTRVPRATSSFDRGKRIGGRGRTIWRPLRRGQVQLDLYPFDAQQDLSRPN